MNPRPQTVSSNTLAFPKYSDDPKDNRQGQLRQSSYDMSSIQQRRNPLGDHIQHLTFAQQSPSYDELRHTYASLPSSPVIRESAMPPFSNVNPTSLPVKVKKEELDESMHIFPPAHNPPYSLWDYLKEELLATDFDSHQELKWERVSNFLSVPIALEKVSRLL